MYSSYSTNPAGERLSSAYEFAKTKYSPVLAPNWASLHREAVNYDQTESSSWEGFSPPRLLHRSPSASSLPAIPIITKKDWKQRHNDHYHHFLGFDSNSKNANPINFEVKRWMKSRRAAHYVNSTSESSTKFDSESFWSSFASE